MEYGDMMQEETVPQEEQLPKMAQDGIHAGFPSPATDYMTQAIDLNKELVKHPAATFYGRVAGDSMVDAGVEEGDILVIDRALNAQDGDMAVCSYFCTLWRASSRTNRRRRTGRCTDCF